MPTTTMMDTKLQQVGAIWTLKLKNNQYERKFNRTTSNFETKETVQDVFAHPDSEGPLTGTGETTKEKIPVEYDIKKTERRIQDTENELKK
mmetsp:Transcript_2272/g.2133  ORF Transcript_2272/g.2133 Transcript_2272/m.2133 type:complete len:91 (+) Transcript_2272:707-979(+)